VTTQLIPIEPIGTKGRIVVRDLTTGEIVELPWMWRRAGFFIWTFLKGLFLKSS
jgi:hypothetical protein